MNISIVGSRTFDDYDKLENELAVYKLNSNDCIISGGAKGADSLAEKYAQEHGIPTKVFRADWKRFGRGAGFIRNRDIVSACDVVLAFWDGKSKGTANTISVAEKQNKVVKIVKFQEMAARGNNNNRR